MPVILTKEIKKKRTLLVVLGALVLASVLILYFGFFSGGSPQSTVLPEGSSNVSLGNQAVSDLDVKILEDERFKNLRSPPGVPVATSTTGKNNPFSD
ncbi:MAG: hypothetical protein AAB722_01880 [Patescibacteria group bacterium]